MTTTAHVAGPAGRLAAQINQPDRGEADGPPIVLLHGVNMTMDVWRDVIDRLSPGRCVVAFDLRGHGQSDKDGPFTADDYADDTVAVLDHFGIGAAHLIGTSFGGSVACTLAAREPGRAISVGSFGGMLAADGFDLDGAVAAIRGAGVRDFFAQFLPQASFKPGTSDDLIDRALGAACEGRDLETVVAVSVAAFTADTTSAAEATEAPAVVVTGELDLTCPVPAGRAFADALDTDHIVIPDAGHVVSMEVPTAVASLIEEHVARVGSS